MPTPRSNSNVFTRSTGRVCGIYMNDVSIALIGSGFVAEFYMQGLANVHGHRVVANYSREKTRAETFAQRWSIPEPVMDLGKLIGRTDIGLYIIALPNEAHLPVSLELSRARKNQVCTKPLGRTRAEARTMLDAARASGALHGYAETEVFAPCVVKARQTIEQRNSWFGRVHFHGCDPRHTHCGLHHEFGRLCRREGGH